MTLYVKFDASGRPEAIFARNASTANKTTQVRQLVNTTLQGLEPGASSLNNANIQIVGLPI